MTAGAGCVVAAEGGGRGVWPRWWDSGLDGISAIDKKQVNGDFPGGPVVKNLP